MLIVSPETIWVGVRVIEGRSSVLASSFNLGFKQRGTELSTVWDVYPLDHTTTTPINL